MPITSEQAMGAAVRSFERALGRSDRNVEQYEGFLVATGDRLDRAAGAIAAVAQHRGVVPAAQQAVLQENAYLEVYCAAVTALLALAHFPYLRSQPHANPNGPEKDVA